MTKFRIINQYKYEKFNKILKIWEKTIQLKRF